ncbi:MAG: Crp/Fnr family transcriptional regulator [Epsilonproteobacteria bacterium]|nr:Crp/Fnr family transcriptional regulator [Campylobacterota bacterium]
MKLEDFYFYSLLSNDSKTFLHQHLKPITMQEKGVLYYQGDVCPNLLIIESGKVRVFLQGENSESFTLYTLGSDELCIVNTFSTIFSTATHANAEVLEELNGWLLSKEALLELMKSEPEYSAYVYSLIAKNMSALVTTIEDIKFASVKDRLEDWIFSQPSTLIKTTHEELALNLGSTRPFVSKLLKDMENEGKVKLGRGVIEIL